MLSRSRFNCKASLLRPLAQLPFASHKVNGMLFLQLNWLWVPLIVTLPITGTTPWYPPRDTQSRGPSLLLTLVHIEQNVKSTSHVSYSFFNFGCKTTISFGVHHYAKCSSLRNKKLAVKGASFFTILKGYFSRSQGHKLGYDLATYLLHQSSQFCVVPIFELPRSSPLCLYFRSNCVNLPKSLRFYNLFTYLCSQMKAKTITFLVISVALSAGITSCKEKAKSDDIYIAKYVPEGPKDPIRMGVDQRRNEVEWMGKPFSVIIKRESSDSLPMLKDETGQKYYDNRVTLTVLRSDSSVFMKKSFTKESFASYVDTDFKQEGIFENIVYHGVEDQKLKFGAVITRPGSEDEFVPLDMYIDSEGGLSITQGKLFDTTEKEESEEN